MKKEKRRTKKERKVRIVTNNVCRERARATITILYYYSEGEDGVSSDGDDKMLIIPGDAVEASAVGSESQLDG